MNEQPQRKGGTCSKTRSGPKIPAAAMGGGDFLFWSLISCYQVMSDEVMSPHEMIAMNT